MIPFNEKRIGEAVILALAQRAQLHLSLGIDIRVPLLLLLETTYFGICPRLAVNQDGWIVRCFFGVQLELKHTKNLIQDEVCSVLRRSRLKVKGCRLQ